MEISKGSKLSRNVKFSESVEKDASSRRENTKSVAFLP
jgi:hypothetical protein